MREPSDRLRLYPWSIQEWFCTNSCYVIYAILIASNMYNVLHTCFDKFLFWVESHDLSQADNSIIRVSSFPSWVMGTRTLFLSQQQRPDLSVKWIHSILSDLALTRKTEKMFTFQSCKTSILPNCQVAKSFFWYNCKFYHSKIEVL